MSHCLYIVQGDVEVAIGNKGMQGAAISCPVLPMVVGQVFGVEGLLSSPASGHRIHDLGQMVQGRCGGRKCG